MKDFVVFSKRLAKALVAQGFVLKEKRLNNKKEGYYIYLFEDTVELKQAIRKTTKTLPNNK